MAYNGWTNRATWLVNLWLGDTLADMAEENGGKIDADQLKSLVDELIAQDCATVEDGLIADLLNCALSQVDWRELAQSASDDVAA